MRKMVLLLVLFCCVACEQAPVTRALENAPPKAGNSTQAAAEAQQAQVTIGPYVSKAGKDRAEVFFDVAPAQPPAKLVLRWSADGEAKEKELNSAGGKNAVTLEGLTAGSEYEYEILAETKPGKLEAISGGRFTTAPEGPGQFRFVVYGDSRSNVKEHTQIADAIASEKPEFVVHTGDYASDGRHSENWENQFFRPAEKMLKGAAFFPALGNHEHRAPIYFDYFGLPKDKAYYSFTWGQIDFFVIDTETDFSPTSEQWKWLDAALAASKAPWKMTAQHVPGISGGTHGFNRQVNQYLRPLYEKYGVDLAFNGHDHTYERTKPIASQAKGGGPPTSAVTYIVTGGGGAELYRIKKNKWDVAACSCYNYVIVDAAPDALRIVAKGRDRKVTDSFTMKKNDPNYLADTVDFESIRKDY